MVDASRRPDPDVDRMANLTEAGLIAARLDDSILTGATLREADLLGATLTGTRCAREDLAGALHLPDRVER